MTPGLHKIERSEHFDSDGYDHTDDLAIVDGKRLLQTRLMDAACEARSLACGAAIAAGFRLTSTGYVGCALALGGLLVWSISRSRAP